jgi:hypothetical protein
LDQLQGQIAIHLITEISKTRRTTATIISVSLETSYQLLSQQISKHLLNLANLMFLLFHQSKICKMLSKLAHQIFKLPIQLQLFLQLLLVLAPQLIIQKMTINLTIALILRSNICNRTYKINNGELLDVLKTVQLVNTGDKVKHTNKETASKINPMMTSKITAVSDPRNPEKTRNSNAKTHGFQKSTIVDANMTTNSPNAKSSLKRSRRGSTKTAGEKKSQKNSQMIIATILKFTTRRIQTSTVGMRSASMESTKTMMTTMDPAKNVVLASLVEVVDADVAEEQVFLEVFQNSIHSNAAVQSHSVVNQTDGATAVLLAITVEVSVVISADLNSVDVPHTNHSTLATHGLRLAGTVVVLVAISVGHHSEVVHQSIPSTPGQVHATSVEAQVATTANRSRTGQAVAGDMFLLTLIINSLIE